MLSMGIGSDGENEIESKENATNANIEEHVLLQEHDVTVFFQIRTGFSKQLGRRLANDEFTRMVKELVPSFADADLANRRLIISNIMATVHNSGGRFLQNSQTGGWEVLPNDVAAVKIRSMMKRAGHKPENDPLNSNRLDIDKEVLPKVGILLDVVAEPAHSSFQRSCDTEE